MGQTNYLNENGDVLDKTQCSEYSFDLCDCENFYHYASTLSTLFPKRCNNLTIYNPKTSVCVHQDDAICQPKYPWKRCNAKEIRMRQLSEFCSNNSDQNTNDGSSNRYVVCSSNNHEKRENITNGINLQMIQTVLPSTVGMLVLIVIIIIFIFLYKRQKKAVSELSEEEDPQYHSVPAGNQNHIVQETRHDPVPLVFPNQLPVDDSRDPAGMNRENPGFNANSPVQSVNTQLGVTASTDSSYESVRGIDSIQ
ncbi:hypothetical protein CHS0354_021758 [Potamilus streckersoni]|uniref:Uncharacterized protein n=1 Tax=Potamilus streckersoni TaxID=2493646 RepID=A0AAE0TKT8_9BIVA|nr:hypothetical protein CHS0354_021758 [Potamilus streckersoni]